MFFCVNICILLFFKKFILCYLIKVLFKFQVNYGFPPETNYSQCNEPNFVTASMSLAPYSTTYSTTSSTASQNASSYTLPSQVS